MNAQDWTNDDYYKLQCRVNELTDQLEEARQEIIELQVANDMSNPSPDVRRTNMEEKAILKEMLNTPSQPKEF